MFKIYDTIQAALNTLLYLQQLATLDEDLLEEL